MSRPLKIPCPSHKFDFGEAVFIESLNSGGMVEGVYSDFDNNTWQYSLMGDRQKRWNEDQLEAACPACLTPWNHPGQCLNCGFSFDDE